MSVAGPLFVYGPMAAGSFLQAALGTPAVDATPDALLPDHGLSAQPGAFPLPGLDDGTTGVNGHIISEPDHVARLIYIGEVLGLGPLQMICPRRDGQEVPARAFRGCPRQ